MAKKIVGIVGSYRKDGIIDLLVDEVLAGAETGGAETEKVYLADEQIEFCRNCRKCTQQPGDQPGECVIDDGFAALLAKCREADGLVLGAPVNFFNINALTRRFMERLVCFAYWPWGTNVPKTRKTATGPRAVVVTSSAMPAFLGRIFTGAPRALKITAKTMGAKVVASLFIGMIAQHEQPTLPAKAAKKARRAGEKLVKALR